MQQLQYRLKQLMVNAREKMASKGGSAAYWTTHLVPYEDFADSQASLEHFHFRNSQYPGYIDLMPVHGADGFVVVDYGCGPGNDLVGFSEFSKPSKLIGIDVSETALTVSKKRLALHGSFPELIHVREEENSIPLVSNSVDLVHSSGVLHHAKNMDAAISEIHRILKPGGKLQVMVYNYNSIWLHLYVAYIHQIEMGLYKDLALLEAFKRTTDGPHCPIAHCYKPSTFLKQVEKNGFEGEFKGAGISILEMTLLSKRFDAIKNRKLSREHRDFLSSLQFNKYGQPTYEGFVAGVDACYLFTKRK